MENAYKTFMAGFTTVQSPGAELDKDLRDWIAEGRIPGPRILTSLRSVTDQTGDPVADSRVHPQGDRRRRRLREDLRHRQHPGRRRPDDDRRADPRGVRRGEGARAALHRPCAGSRRREGRGSGGMYGDRARQPADRRSARSDGPARDVLRLEQPPAAAQLHREQGSSTSGAGTSPSRGSPSWRRGCRSATTPSNGRWPRR